MTKGPLEGIRAYFIGSWWAGPMCSSLLSDMGAEVIRQETHARIDPWRFDTIGITNDPLNPEKGPYSQDFARNQLSILLNPTKPKARELALAILKTCDIFFENTRAGTLEKWGLDYNSVREVNPSIIMCSISSFGQNGPLIVSPSFGQGVVGLSGLGALQGYRGEAPLGIMNPYPDPIGGVAGFFAMMAALHHRKRTGKGQYIDVSMAEATGTMLGKEMMDYIMNRRVATCMGNYSSWIAPHGCYRCQGEDKWVTIACATEEEWKTLCLATGNPQWTEDERFVDNYARLNHLDELNELITSWTINHSNYEVMEILQKAGVAAAPVLNTDELITDPHQQEEKYHVHLPHPYQPLCYVYTSPWKLSETPGGPYRHAPLLGEHSEYVFREICGLSKDEFDKLVEEKVIW